MNMSVVLHLVLALGLVFCVQTIRAQESVYAVKQLNDHIYELSYDAGGYVVKVIASAGNDGVLLVDTGHRAKAEALKAVLQERWNAEPKFIILSHEHVEHLGGTEIFGTAPTVIGHPSLKSVLRSGHFLFDEYTDATLPDITVSDSYSLTFNGEEIRIISVAGGHSGSDLIVWFTNSGIACVDGLCNWPYFPSIDDFTGNVPVYPAAVKRVLGLLPENTQVVPGHGQDCTMAEFRQFHDMLVQTRDIVTAELAQGKTMEALQKEDVLKAFRGYEGSYTSVDAWIEYLVKGAEDRPRNTRKSMFETMYYTLKEKGTAVATAQFSELKRDHADEYEFDETTPALIGYLLINRKKYPEAIAFLQLSLREYPEGSYANLSYKLLGRAFEETADTGQALEYYRKLIARNPSDTTTARKVKELEGN